MPSAPTPAAAFSPEQELVLQCLRFAFEREDEERIDYLAGTALDWSKVLALALSQGLVPVVHIAVAALDLPVPDPVAGQLRAGYLGALLRAEAVVDPLLRRALGALADRGLAPVVLKGAALAYAVYPAPCLRTMSDVDLLLPREQAAEASAVLVELGLREDGDDRHSHHHLPMHYLDEAQLGVEVHRHVLPAPNPYAISLEDLVARATTATIAGKASRALDPVDALHLACVHTSYSHRYRWFSLRGLADVLAITSTLNGGLDWGLFVETTRRSRTAGAVYWPLLLAQEWLGAPVPAAVLARLAPPAWMRRLVGGIAEPGYILAGEAPEGAGSRVLYNLLLNFSLHSGCTLGEQARALGRGFFPAPEDVGHLPPAVARSRLRFAAYMLRPGRLAHGLVAGSRLARRLREG